jgi:signal transduction histidine kinase/AraC-like DNA-binding protein
MFLLTGVCCLQNATNVIASDTLSSIPALYPSTYTVYDLEQGLPQSCVSGVYEDHKGRLWLNHCKSQEILQSQGFYQYDGSKYHEVSMNDPDDPDSRRVYFIEGITETGLLFGADKERLKCFVLNPDTLQKQFFSFDEGESVLHVMPGESNEVFVLTEKENNRMIYRLVDGIKNLMIAIPFDKDSEAENYTMNMSMVRSEQSIWLLNGHLGFMEYNIKRNSVSRYEWKNLLAYTFMPVLNEEAKVNRIRISVDHEGNPLFFFWELNRFYVFDKPTGKLNQMEQLDDFFYPAGNKAGEVPEFYKDAQGNTLINVIRREQSANVPVYYSTTALLDNKGILYDYTPIALLAKKGRFNNFVGTYFYSDNFKRNVAIATTGGLIMVDLKVDFSIQNFLKGRPIRAITEVSSMKYLVINEIGQQVIIDQDGNETSFQHIFPATNSTDFIAGLSQLIQKKDKIWFATTHDQLASFQKSTFALSIFEVGIKFEKFNFISDRKVALVDYKYDLYVYDLSEKELRPFVLDGSPLNIQGTANELYVSRDSILWIASSNGLWKIDYKAETSSRLGKENGFRDDRIMCIMEAPDSKLWLGTYSEGIHIYNPKTGFVEVKDQNDGLSNNTVVGLLQDNEGYWWASTFDGISVLSEDGQVLFELSENEGLSHREFNRFSYLKTSDGKLLFGAVDGVNLLDPEKIKNLAEIKEDLQIYLTDIAYFDKTVDEVIHIKNPDKWSEQIIIPAAHRYIELDFGLSEYTNPEKTNYFYRIQKKNEVNATSEPSEKWTSIGFNSNLVLNNLPTGEYNILIKAINYKGQWIKDPLVISVSVEEFFYKTWWFYLLCSIPLLLGAYFWIHRLTTERERLEKEVTQRTRQIRLDKELIEKQAAELQELDELKSRFFTNISHEFRTPLTVISGMIAQMEQQPDRWMKKGTELIKRNSDHLLSLINQILDLRKIESNALKPNLILGDIIPFLKYLADSFTPMAQSKGIRIHFLSAISSLEMDYDPDKMLHILSNLLSNAIKFTNGPGDIYIQVNQQSDANTQETLNIQVRDTGKGISQEALPYIFDRFYQVKDLATQKPMGTGIGLALTMELVKLLNGTIQVESTSGVGTSFSLNFSVTRESPNQSHDFMAFNPSIVEQEQPIISEEKDVVGTGLQQDLLNLSIIDEDTGHESQPTLLIVEDNPDVRIYLTSCLENQYHLIYAENGQTGTDLALERVPDLIVSDVMMPVKDGFALCNTLKEDERTSHIPIVLLTAKADFDSKIQGLRKGADAYLTKPFSEEELLIILRNLLELRKKLQQKYAGLSFAADKKEENVTETPPDFEDAFLKKLQQIVVSQIDNPDLSGEFICREMKMSRTNLFRKLKALTDLSISHFIRKIRLQQARELLLTSEMNISEVAYAVGFSDPKYFSRLFSETFQQSPSQFRDH